MSILNSGGLTMGFIERPRFSCALGGALSTINALPRVAPIIHAASGCGGNLFGAANAGSGFFGSGYCGGSSVPSTNITETEIIYGGDSRLSEEIAATLELIDADLFVVTTGCMTEIIADDVKGVLNSFKDSEKPILAIETGGFRGNSYKGYEITLEKLFMEYTERTEKKDKKLVNIFGLVPAFDPFFRGDLAEIKRLLEELGLRVNTFFTNDQTLENLRGAGAASLNIVLSRVYGNVAAKSFEEKHGVPFYITELPIGPTATDEFLRSISKILGIRNKKAEEVIAKENNNYYKFVERVADFYTDGDFQHYSVVVGNSNNVISLIRFLREDLGWIPKLAVITDELDDNQKRNIIKRFGELGFSEKVKLVFETDTSKIQEHLSKIAPITNTERYFDKLSPLFILGSALEKDLASTFSAKTLTVSYPILNRVIFDRNYAGYSGGLNLFEDLLNSILSGR